MILSKNKIILGFLFFIFQNLLVYGENKKIDNIQRCEVSDDDLCILSNGLELKKGEQCVTNNGYLYVGINDFGKCEYVKYIYIYDNSNENNKFRDIIPPPGDNSPSNNDNLNNIYLLFQDEEGTIPEIDGSIGYLYYCSESDSCNKVNEVGYYLNNQDDIFLCGKNGNKCEEILPKEKCDVETIGELFIDSKDNTKIRLCLNHDGAKSYDIDLSEESAGNYIINHRDGIIFGTSGNNQYALVKVEKHSVTLNKSSGRKFKYIYVDENNKVLNDGMCTSEDEAIVEFNCEDAICTKN